MLSRYLNFELKSASGGGYQVLDVHGDHIVLCLTAINTPPHLVSKYYGSFVAFEVYS